jgi:DNA-binding MarR family transcriptional regulator
MKLEAEIKQKRFLNSRQKAIVNLIYTNNWVVYRQAALLKRFGVTIQQYNILRILRGQHPNPANIKLIKERMLDKMSDASRIVEKLRLKELVDRKICPDDRRNVDVLINKKGLELLRDIDDCASESETITQNLSENELVQLNELLDKLRG